MVILSQYDAPDYAVRLLEDGAAGFAYLLKDRVADGALLSKAIRAVATGGSLIDPEIAAALVRPVHDGRLAADGTVDDVLRGRAGDLHEMGVWLPVSAIAALRLRQAGFTLDPLPLTPDELRAALDAEPAPAGLADAEPASRSSSE